MIITQHNILPIPTMLISLLSLAITYLTLSSSASTVPNKKLLHPYLPHSPRNHTRTDIFLYPQADLARIGVKERRQLVWNKQIEYSGQTFFDGYA
jgi:hypothetical protein